MKISEIITDKYKLRMPPTVYYDLLADVVEIEEQEPKTFKWCTDCREYDQEKHCCHRWSKVIRDTVEEMKQEQEPKTGHWILDDTDNSITCNKCGCLIWANDISNGEAYYCPNCGCHMVEPQESEDKK